jgi:sulfate/thiosulfate transport system permease protein
MRCDQGAGDSMALAPVSERSSRRSSAPRSVSTGDPLWFRVLLGALAAGFLGLFVLVPVAAVLFNAFEKGIGAFLGAVSDPEALSAIRLTLMTAAIAVPLNVTFGIAAAWAVAKFEFPGRSVLTTVIDLPFAVSPVISGMIFVLLFGGQGWLGPFLSAHNLKIIFALPGIVLATTFVTFPFVARELIPIMQTAGKEEEEAALVLGASGWQMLRRVTLPNVKWGLLYGAILCNARAMGEFGAVSVVSGKIRGLTTTMPLYVEILYNEYNFAAAFAVSSLLTLLALVTIIAKRLIAGRTTALAARLEETGEEKAAA